MQITKKTIIDENVKCLCGDTSEYQFDTYSIEFKKYFIEEICSSCLNFASEDGVL